ncbi:hypothetical protein ACHHYP_11507 [Achlya hypogyna]|uniref:Mbre TPR repeat protein n=1 Tax=Achlya hypogyna TaxID=1202772 RepID=A0A1V9YJ16_ACHHY|nr:hypothetical protein ACHHYP_11507 [Achlya hypogyna]
MFTVAPPPIPLGVKVSSFGHLIEHLGGRSKLKGLTTAQVCFDCVMPYTKATQLSLVNHLLADPETTDFVAPATWYVSHAWSYVFLETVESLEAFITQQNLPMDTAVWFCAFNNNQHFSSVRPFSFWASTFKNELAAIGNVVMIMHPWADPVVLHRSWRVFEVYVAICVHARFEVAMAPTQRELFYSELDTDESAFLTVVKGIKSETSQASVPADRISIFEVIRTEVGFTQLDRKIFVVFFDWLLGALSEKASRATSPCEKARWLVAIAAAYSSSSDHIGAKKHYYLAWKLYRTTLGVNHETTLKIMSKLGYAYVNIGTKVAQGISVLSDCVRLQAEVLGAESEMVAITRTYLSLGLLLGGEAFAALAEGQTAFAVLKRRLGEANRHTLRAMAQVTTAFLNTLNYSAAITWGTQLLALQEEHMGHDSTETIKARQNLAVTYMSSGQPEAAISLINRAIADLSRTWGPDNRLTMLATVNLSRAYMLNGELQAALNYAVDAHTAAFEAFGTSDRVTLLARSMLCRIALAQKDFAAVMVYASTDLLVGLKLPGMRSSMAYFSM